MTTETTSGLTSDLRVVSTEKLPTPDELASQIPLTETAQKTIISGRSQVQDILSGKDSRLLVVAGPCSVHDEKAALDYADRLVKLAEEVKDQICVVMRVYFEKPRTILGWKGLIYDPNLNGKIAIKEGLERARKILLAVNEKGLPAGAEFLDPIVPAYLADLVTWSSIGARTTESQTHRQMASGLSMPVGFKNATSGSIDIAVNGIRAARAAQAFIGIDTSGQTSVVNTAGNNSAHLVLRGGEDGPNYEAAQVANAQKILTDAGLQPRLVVDCSHANAGKKHENEHVVFESLISQRLQGNTDIAGCMLESFISPGNQALTENIEDLKYGVSITDACIGWDETAELLSRAAKQLASE